MIGNDIVDLRDPGVSRGTRHARFDRRVFAPEEREVLAGDPLSRITRWKFWSAKEAAYKAARRECAHIAFSPARFVVELDRPSCGWVRHGDRRWPVRIQVAKDCVHAVVSREGRYPTVLSGYHRLGASEQRDPSQSVRRFAISSIAAELEVVASDLRIEKIDRIPHLIIAGKSAFVPLSLSHHGAFVGFACSDLRFGGNTRRRRANAIGAISRSRHLIADPRVERLRDARWDTHP